MMNILEEMSSVSGCKGAMLVGRDGLVILQNMTTGTDAKALGALAATLVGISEYVRHCSWLIKGSLEPG